jgi:hypothetical protein
MTDRDWCEGTIVWGGKESVEVMIGIFSVNFELPLLLFSPDIRTDFVLLRSGDDDACRARWLGTCNAAAAAVVVVVATASVLDKWSVPIEDDDDDDDEDEDPDGIGRVNCTRFSDAGNNAADVEDMCWWDDEEEDDEDDDDDDDETWEDWDFEDEIDEAEDCPEAAADACLLECFSGNLSLSLLLSLSSSYAAAALLLSLSLSLLIMPSSLEATVPQLGMALKSNDISLGFSGSSYSMSLSSLELLRFFICYSIYNKGYIQEIDLTKMIKHKKPPIKVYI